MNIAATRSVTLVLASLAVSSAPACRRNRATPVTQATPPATPPTQVGPAGTTPTTPTDPAHQQVQITGQAAAGASSIRSVPPTPASGCPAQLSNSQLGPGTVHNNEVTGNETWTLEGSPHRLPDGMTIRTGASVTVTPCAVVLLAAHHTFTVDDGGALMAIGDATHPIRIGSDNPAPQPGDWDGLWFAERARATSRLAFVTVEHSGGGSHGLSGCIMNRLNALDLQDVTTSACRGFGVSNLEGGGFSATSTNLRVTGTVAGDTTNSGSVSFENADMVRTLPTGTYAGGQVSEIFLASGTNVVRTAGQWRNPGVRYHVADNIDLRVEGPTGPVLSIAPGTTVAFGRGSWLTIGWDAEGGLTADGQAEATRIVFQGAGTDASPGAWNGVSLGERFNRTRTRLNFVTIQNAGGADLSTCDWHGGSTDHAGLYIAGAPASNQLVSNVRFLGLPPDGAAIARNFGGAAPLNFADPALHNDFAHAGATCHQSPQQSANGCPEDAPCQ